MYKSRKSSFSSIRYIKKVSLEIDKLIEDEGGLGYKKLVISVFSHWLTAKEANELLDNIPNNIERTRTIKLQQFIISLCKKFDCYLIVDNVKRQVPKYKKVIQKEQIKVSHSRIPNSDRIILIIPELRVVYFENCDFTHYFYYQDKKLLYRFENLVKKKGLYLIQ